MPEAVGQIRVLHGKRVTLGAFCWALPEPHVTDAGRASRVTFWPLTTEVPSTLMTPS